MATPKFKTFVELSEYALSRAVKSADRNDPIAWAYWRETAAWAFTGATSPEGSLRQAQEAFPLLLAKRVRAAEAGKWTEAAADHSRVKWCAAILRAHGKKVKVSLDWMRGVAP